MTAVVVAPSCCSTLAYPGASRNGISTVSSLVGSGDPPALSESTAKAFTLAS